MKNINSLKNDLLNVYCKTLNKDIEDVFIKIANAGDPFTLWLSNVNSLSLGLTDQQVVTSIQFALKLQKELGSTINMSALVSFLAQGKAPAFDRLVPYFKTFNDLLSENSTAINAVLGPISNIVSLTSRMAGTPVDKATVKKDVEAIHDYYIGLSAESSYVDAAEKMQKPKRESLKERMRSTWSYFAHKFEEEILAAGRAAGYEKIAEKLDGKISNPYEILSIINVEDSAIPRFTAEIRAKVVPYIKKSIKSKGADELYERVRTVVMERFNIISKEENAEYWRQWLKNDLSYKGSSQEEVTPVAAPPNKVFSANYIFYVSLILYIFHDELTI